MREPILQNGDYRLSGGNIRYAEGGEAVLERVLFRLRARRGRFPFCEGIGSRLWQLSSLSPGQRPSAAEQYVAEALADEPVRVERVELTEQANDIAALTVVLLWEDETLTVTLEVQ